MANHPQSSEKELFPAILRHWLISRSLVTGLALICYLNSCWGDFVFDDSEAILNNKDVDPGASSVAEVFAHDFWGSKIALNTSHKSYRPLTVLTFRLSYWLAGGRHPFYFHLLNVLLHPIVCLLLLDVLDHWSRECRNSCKRGISYQRARCVPTVPLVAALLFAVHPIHTESVSGVVGRAELTSALCFMASLLTYSLCCGQSGICCSIPYLLSTLVLAGCAMLFKEQGITVLGVCVTYEIVLRFKLLQVPHLESTFPLSWNSLKRMCLRVAVLIAGGALLVWARIRVMATGAPQFKPIDNPASFADSWITRTLSYNYVYAINWWLLFHPWWLCFDWSMGCVPLLHSLADPRALAPIVFWAGLGALAVVTISRLQAPNGRLMALSLSLLVLPFLPSSNLIFRVGFVVAERVLYLSSAGHCLLVAIGATSIATHSLLMKRIVQVSLIYLLTLFTLRSIQRSSQWLNEGTLFVSGIHVCPLNAKVHYNIGKVMSDAGLTTQGEAAYREAIRLYPEYDQALNNLANLMKDSNRLIEAELYLERAIKSNNEFAAAWMNLGIVQAALNKTKEAEDSYKKAITHRRRYPDAYYNMGNLYIDTGRPGDAMSAFNTAISQQREHSNAWINLGLLYEDLKMFEDAEKVMKEAISIMPNDPRFYFSLGVLLGKTKRLEEGESYLVRAVEMRPDRANYHANLGVIYHMEKRYDLAEKCYETALELDPTLTSAQENMNKLHLTVSKLSKY